MQNFFDLKIRGLSSALKYMRAFSKHRDEFIWQHRPVARAKLRGSIKKF